MEASSPPSTSCPALSAPSGGGIFSPAFRRGNVGLAFSSSSPPSATSPSAPSGPAPSRAHAGVHFFAGAVGGAAAATILSPLDIVRTRLQSSQTSGTNIKAHRLLANIVKKEGFFALWRGLMPTIFGVGPSRAIYFGSYNVCKRYLEPGPSAVGAGGKGGGLEGTALHLTGATIAGFFTNTVMSPWWVIRLRLQLQHTPVKPFWTRFFGNSSSSQAPSLSLATPQPASAAGASAGAVRTFATDATSTLSSSPLSNTTSINRPYKGVVDAALRIYREEGWRTFYRGLTASYLGVAETALQFAIYGAMKDWLKKAEAKEREARLRIAAGATAAAVASQSQSPGLGILSLLPSQSWAFGISAFSKLLASALTYPHEVIRTRMREQKGKDSASLKYRGILQCAKLIMREEGARGLYGGLGVHLLRTVPNAAILLFVVETMVGGEV